MKNIISAAQASVIPRLAEAVVWGEMPAPHISIATYTDTTNLDEAELLLGLSETEQKKAHSIVESVEKRHFIVRRCFQRIFVKTVLNWHGSLASLQIEHQLDTQPRCLDAPLLRLSFSSSGQTAIACASTQHRVGVDIEKLRTIENVVKLAHRFFTPEEATTIEAMPERDQNMAFLKYWTAKEAGLKAIGKGIVSGLNSFAVKPHNSGYHIDNTLKSDVSTPWILHHMTNLPNYIVAVVHNLEK